ncbi:helix-turn-helix domain-containing protein [Flavobacterium cellulosilyticum]|uniref:XRE family transcriptional regulator n=1 Tax=Flavobacterium cellulosilyticum TaxID=2541731 RepID=A0A4R5C8F4_9FLAO|nr:helix-turn-helix transcriptional regulator [Flavobacterium cellulosilyticum]TDD95059.1 XRE family transcriptional regulator [Flavobacterium cellulosilyticum]
MNIIISKNIRTIREMKNLSREYMADELGMTASGYGKIERGEIELTINKISNIAAIFEISISDLLFFEISSFFNNSRDKRLGINSNLNSLKTKTVH